METSGVVWTKVSRIWWPAQVTQEYPEEITSSLRKKPLAVVKFFDEDSFETIANASLMLDYREEKRVEFIRKGLIHLKTPRNAKDRDKFIADVKHAESLTGGNPDEVDDIISKGVDAPTTPKKSLYAEIFKSSPKEPPPTQTPPSNTIKFNFKKTPKAQGSPKKDVNSTPQQAGPPKKYSCDVCHFSTDRVGALTSHRKMHSSTTPMKPSPNKTSLNSTSTHVAGPPSTPPAKTKIETPKKSASKEKPGPAKKRGRKKKEQAKQDILNDWSDEEFDGNLNKETEEVEDATMPFMKKMRTDKELSDAFEALLQSTQPPTLVAENEANSKDVLPTKQSDRPDSDKDNANKIDAEFHNVSSANGTVSSKQLEIANIVSKPTDSPANVKAVKHTEKSRKRSTEQISAASKRAPCLPSPPQTKKSAKIDPELKVKEPSLSVQSEEPMEVTHAENNAAEVAEKSPVKAVETTKASGAVVLAEKSPDKPKPSEAKKAVTKESDTVISEEKSSIKSAEVMVKVMGKSNDAVVFAEKSLVKPVALVEKSLAKQVPCAEKSAPKPVVFAEKPPIKPVDVAEKSALKPPVSTEKSQTKPAVFAEKSPLKPIVYAEKSPPKPVLSEEKSPAKPVVFAEKSTPKPVDIGKMTSKAKDPVVFAEKSVPIKADIVKITPKANDNVVTEKSPAKTEIVKVTPKESDNMVVFAEKSQAKVEVNKPPVKPADTVVFAEKSSAEPVVFAEKSTPKSVNVGKMTTKAKDHVGPVVFAEKSTPIKADIVKMTHKANDNAAITAPAKTEVIKVTPKDSDNMIVFAEKSGAKIEPNKSPIKPADTVVFAEKSAAKSVVSAEKSTPKSVDIGKKPAKANPKDPVVFAEKSAPIKADVLKITPKANDNIVITEKSLAKTEVIKVNPKDSANTVVFAEKSAAKLEPNKILVKPADAVVFAEKSAAKPVNVVAKPVTSMKSQNSTETPSGTAQTSRKKPVTYRSKKVCPTVQGKKSAANPPIADVSLPPKEPMVSIKGIEKPTAAIRPTVNIEDDSIIRQALQGTLKSSPELQPTSTKVEGELESEREMGAMEEGGNKLAEQVVHLVPVENPDGTVTYMLLSLGNQGELRIDATEGAAPTSDDGAIYMDKTSDGDAFFASITQPNTSTTMAQQNASQKSVVSGATQSTAAHQALLQNQLQGMQILQSNQQTNELIQIAHQVEGTSMMEVAPGGAGVSQQAATSAASTMLDLASLGLGTSTPVGQQAAGEQTHQTIVFLAEDGTIINPESVNWADYSQFINQ